MVLLALQDIFLTLFHPAGRGAMSDLVARVVWNAFRPLGRLRQRHMTYAGPAAFAATVGAWAALVVFGCALVYFPRMNAGFALAPGMDPAAHTSFLDAFNVSLGSLITLAGDFNAHSGWIRLLMGVEAVIGFGLLTASVSWLLSIYPVLENRRSLAHQAGLLHHAEAEQGVDAARLPAEQIQAALRGLAAGMTGLRNQVAQFPITYYFHMGDEKTALPGIIGYLYDLALRASRPENSPAVRLAGTELGGAVDDFLILIAETFLRMPVHDRRAIMRAYAADQMYELVQTGYRPPRQREAA